MQAMFKCFELFSPEGTSLAMRKIAFKIKAGEGDFASQDTTAFLDSLGALMAGSEGTLKSSQDQFEWVPLEGEGQLPAEVIDLTTKEALPYSLIAMLLGNEGTDGAEAPPDDTQENLEAVMGGATPNDMLPNLVASETSTDDPLEETETLEQAETATEDIETTLQPTEIENSDTTDLQLDAQQSAAYIIASDIMDESEESGNAAENLQNEDPEKPFAFSLNEKSKFKLIFSNDKNPQAGHSQSIPLENAPKVPGAHETAEVKTDTKGVAVGLRTRANESQTTITENPPKVLDAKETAEVKTDTKGVAVGLSTRANESQTTITENPPKVPDAKETADVQQSTNSSSAVQQRRADGASTAMPDVSSQPMEAIKHAEAHRSANGSSFSQATPQEYTEQASLTTSKGEDTIAVKSPDISNAWQDNSQQHAFKNESGDSGQNQQSGFMFRESFHHIDAHAGGAFKEVVAAPNYDNLQTAVQDKTLQNDVIRQIVQRMNLRGDQLQSQMNIKLKPEFLGDLRLQISTANQHVSIKMTAESASVKEMIEANIAVLKNELQQHGLHIDKFDVFVGQESDAWKQREQQAASRQERRSKSFSTIQAGEDEDESDIQMDLFMRGGSRRFRQNDTGEIDFFA